MSNITPDDKIAISQLYVKLVEEGCASPFSTAMEIALMDKAVDFLKTMAENSDKLHKILDMMDSRILGLQSRIEAMDANVVAQLQGINHQVSGD